MNEPDPNSNSRRYFPVVLITLMPDDPNGARRDDYRAGVRFFLEQHDYDRHPFRTKYDLDKFVKMHNMAIVWPETMARIRKEWGRADES